MGHIENCVCGIRSIERKMRLILRTVVPIEIVKVLLEALRVLSVILHSLFLWLSSSVYAFIFFIIRELT